MSDLLALRFDGRKGNTAPFQNGCTVAARLTCHGHNPKLITRWYPKARFHDRERT